ncbi:MAG: hypothetical protein IJE62_05090, partial [Clostridia bacterium]|nr:hypothetical protein [Clostridia bacterium]
MSKPLGFRFQWCLHEHFSISLLHPYCLFNAALEDYEQFVFGYHLDAVDELSGYAVIVVDW